MSNDDKPCSFSPQISSANISRAISKGWLNLSAYAKVNLSLSVGEKREDGYHDIWSLMYITKLADRLSLRILPCNEFSIRVDADVPLPYDNTIRRAVNEFFRAFAPASKLPLAVEAHIEKRIPSQAGLGGASADAAAVINALNSVFDARIPLLSLLVPAKRVGSDVPFCMYGGCAIVQGRGEYVTALATPSLRPYLLIAKPTQGANTSLLFSLLDEARKKAPTQITDQDERRVGLISAVGHDAFDCHALRRLAQNDFAPIVYELVPEVERIRDTMYGAGAEFAAMTGSGTAVFGLFSSLETYNYAERSLKDRFPQLSLFSG